MVNTKLLNEYIKKSGFKIWYLASELGISVNSFNKKRANKQSFLVSEVNKLRRLLQISNAASVFFSAN